MSDMTDAEVLRSYAGELAALADRLDASGWRDEPPDTEGDWVRKRDGVNLLIGLPEDMPIFVDRIHQPGDRWLKLPPTP